MNMAIWFFFSASILGGQAMNHSGELLTLYIMYIIQPERANAVKPRYSALAFNIIPKPELKNFGVKRYFHSNLYSNNKKKLLTSYLKCAQAGFLCTLADFFLPRCSICPWRRTRPDSDSRPKMRRGSRKTWALCLDRRRSTSDARCSGVD